MSQPNCLIRQSACSLQVGQTECPKCGIRTDGRYVSQEDLDMAVAKGTALYWQNHAQALERTIEAQEKAQCEQLELAEIERAKAESARAQAQKEKQEAEARRAQEKSQREAAEQRAAQEKAKRDQLERAEIERAKAESARLQAQKDKQEAEVRREHEKADRERLEREEAERQPAVRVRRTPGQVFQDLPIAPQMVVLPSGRYMMGSESERKLSFLFRWSECPQHEVIIAYKLAIGRYPVTFDEWDACVADGGTNYKPGDYGWGRGKRPVIGVSWDDAQVYIAWLNKKLGIAHNDPRRYRLPSEAEWEYACGAGGQTKWSFGNDEEQLKEYAWYKKNSGNRTQLVGQKKANAFGLYDMHGNVLEWVQDGAHFDYNGAPSDGAAWENANSKYMRMLRGGSWRKNASESRNSFREPMKPEYRFDAGSKSVTNGFRLARTLS